MDRSSHAAIEEFVGERLTDHRLTISVAESCTGGFLGHRITNIPGSSRYFMGGVIAYDNEAKVALLGVPRELIEREGAVSREVCLAMARAVRRILQTDVALSITGIAGPGGGTPTKPVGTTYVALVAPGFERCEHYVWQGDRASNKVRSTEAALRLLQDYLEELDRETVR
jgi:PncC family amidohydrolase